MLNELYAAKALLEWTERAVLNWGYMEEDAHPLFAVGAASAERFLKLAYGMATLVSTGQWPGQSIHSYGHRIAALDRDCRDILAARVGNATAPGWIAECVGKVTADPWIDDWLNLLSVYADTGRYEKLDILAGRTPKGSPKGLLAELEARILERYPHGDEIDIEAMVRFRNESLHDSLRNWRQMYGYAWAHGVFGENAKLFGWMLKG
jgi:hypothetical protein